LISLWWETDFQWSNHYTSWNEKRVKAVLFFWPYLLGISATLPVPLVQGSTK
jgi:hypothetical protein